MVTGGSVLRVTPKLRAICAKSWKISTWWTTGVRPYTSPPVSTSNFDYSTLYAQIIYIRLHGIPAGHFLYGDNGIIALTTKEIENASYKNSIVFLGGCFGADYAQAFLSAGASTVIGSNTPTYGKKWFLGPADKFGKIWLKEMYAGKAALEALEYARKKTNLESSWFLVGEGAKYV